jgi:hypothetical protein
MMRHGVFAVVPDSAPSTQAGRTLWCVPALWVQPKEIAMQDNAMQASTQPFFKLVQANMDLLSKFSTAPEVTGQASASASNLFQQASESATSLMQSGAFAHMLQGLLKNYTDFLAELSQSSMAMLSQGQHALVQQTQAVTESVADASDVRRRARQAA